MSLKHGLLGFLNYGSMTGYELDKAFKESLDLFWMAQTSQIYRELNSMEKLGWLTSERILQEDKPNKKLYTLTKQGRDELKSWLGKSNNNEGIYVKNGFLMKIFFSGERSTDENIKALKKYKYNCEKALERLGKTGSSIDHYKNQILDKDKAFYWGIAAEYGYYYYMTSIKWADEIIKRLEDIK
jgi:PadR family transcriptional regulator, regulatory protein AphA